MDIATYFLLILLGLSSFFNFLFLSVTIFTIGRYSIRESLIKIKNATESQKIRQSRRYIFLRYILPAWVLLNVAYWVIAITNFFANYAAFQQWSISFQINQVLFAVRLVGYFIIAAIILPIAEYLLFRHFSASWTKKSSG